MSVSSSQALPGLRSREERRVGCFLHKSRTDRAKDVSSLKTSMDAGLINPIQSQLLRMAVLPQEEEEIW